MNDATKYAFAYGMLIAGIEVTIDQLRSGRELFPAKREQMADYLTDLLKRAEAQTHEQ